MKYTISKTAQSLFLAAIIFLASSQIAYAAHLSNLPIETRAYGSSFNPEPIFLEEPTFQERDIFILVNYQRKQQRLKPMKWDHGLARMARYYSRKMALDNYFEHEDLDGKTVVDRADEFRIVGWEKIGENLFYSEGYLSPVRVAVDGWLESPGHRLNMFDKEWTHSAIGVYEKSGMRTYITQVFMKR